MVPDQPLLLGQEAARSALEPAGRNRGDGELLNALFLALAVLSSVGVRVTGAPPFPPLPDSTEVTDEAMDRLRLSALDWYLQEGYPFAAVALYLSSPETLTVNTVPGRHALLEEIMFPDSVRTDPGVLLRTLETVPGEPYSSRGISRWLRSVERLPFIESVGPVSAALGPGGNLALIVPVQESPPGWFSGDIDFTSSGGFTGGGEVVFTNLFGTGRRLELRGAAVEWGGVDASGLYREPWILGSPVSVEFSGYQQVPDSGSVLREWSASLILSLGSLEVSGGGGTWRSYPLNAPDESFQFASAGLAWDLTGRERQGRAGFSGEVDTDGGRASGPDSTYLLTRARGSMSYQWFRGALGLGGVLRAGGIVSGRRLSTMVTRIGGYGSFRGYPEDSWRAGAWAVASPEVSLGETPTRIYVYSDAGVIDTGSDGTKYPLSVGGGLRGSTAGLRFDAGAGFPLDRGAGSARFYLSAGVNI